MQPAIAEFTRDVHAYVNLHRMVAASMPSEKMYADLEQLQRHINRLAEALRTERAAARVGDVFRPAIASLFKRRLAHAIRRSALRGQTLEPQQAPQDEPRLEVNDAFPWMAQPGIPPDILATLTPLPPGLEYRFVYRDLVLVDVGSLPPSPITCGYRSSWRTSWSRSSSRWLYATRLPLLTPFGVRKLKPH